MMCANRVSACRSKSCRTSRARFSSPKVIRSRCARSMAGCAPAAAAATHGSAALTASCGGAVVLPDWGGMGPVAFLSGWNMDAAALLRPKLVDNGQGGANCDCLPTQGSTSGSAPALPWPGHRPAPARFHCDYWGLVVPAGGGSGPIRAGAASRRRACRIM